MTFGRRFGDEEHHSKCDFQLLALWAEALLKDHKTAQQDEPGRC